MGFRAVALGDAVAARYRASVAKRAASIRRLLSGDAAAVEQLNDVFAAAFDDAEQYQSSRPTRRYSEELLQKAHVIALVAETDGAIVGGIVAYQLDKFEQQRSEIYIYDLAVSAPHRRLGIATLLIDTLRQWGAARGAWVIYVQADYGDDPAIALYTKLGSRADVIHFDIPIGSG